MNPYALLTIALLGWGVWGALNKSAQTRLYPVQVSVMSALSSFITLPIYLMILWSSGKTFKWDPFGMIIGLCAGLVGAIATIAYTFALGKISVTTANAWNAANPVVTCLLCIIFFKESPTIIQWIGMALVVFGVFLVSR